VPWRDSGITFNQALRQSGAHDFISFRFDVNFGKGREPLELAAPIPPNSDRDLRRLQEKLSSSYPSARVQLA
jgi:hypothetical protein